MIYLFFVLLQTICLLNWETEFRTVKFENEEEFLTIQIYNYNGLSVL